MLPSTLITLTIALGASLFMAWVIGAGSSGATPFAPAVGANAISILRAAFLVGFLVFAGAVLQGANVSEAVGTGLVEGVSLSPAGAIIGLGIGASLMALGIFTGYPIATAFTVTGAVIGVGLALGGSPAWPKYHEIAALWLLTPILGGGTAYGLATILPRPDVPERLSIPILGGFVGFVLATIDFAVLGGISRASSLASILGPVVPGGWLTVSLGLGLGVVVVLRMAVERNQPRAIQGFLLVLGGLVAFSAGGSQVGLAIGPLLPLLDDIAVPLTGALVGGGLGMLVGAWTGSPRMIKSLSRDYSALGPRRSISALIPSFVIAQSAVFLGVPISFNEIIVSAIVGSGLAVGNSAGVSRRKISITVVAWTGSFVVALGIGYGLMRVVPLG
jgi:PiT family inorganic phosphate transporter